MNIEYKKETVRIALPRPTNTSIKIEPSLFERDFENFEKSYNRRCGMRSAHDTIRRMDFDSIDENG